VRLQFELASVLQPGIQDFAGSLVHFTRGYAKSPFCKEKHKSRAYLDQRNRFFQGIEDRAATRRLAASKDCAQVHVSWKMLKMERFARVWEKHFFPS
jgi:hypothetical protein